MPMKKLVSACLAAALAASTLSGCVRQDKYAESLRVGTTELPKNLNPYASVEDSATFFVSLFYDTLLGSAPVPADDVDGEPYVFPDGTALFTCSSWLLDPWNLTVLNPASNLAAFIGDFEIVSSHLYDGYGDLWRLFDCNYTGDPAALPRDSSLRRAYADRVARGEPTGSGRGFFRMRDGEIVR